MKIRSYITFDSKQERVDFMNLMELISSDTHSNPIQKTMQIQQKLGCSIGDASEYLNIYLTSMRKTSEK